MMATRTWARVAGFLYLLVVVTGIVGLKVIPDMFWVKGDATATADKIRASELLFRTGIAVELLGFTIFVVLVLALYQIFKSVDQRQATAMLILALISVPIAFVSAVNNIAADTLVNHPDFLSVFQARQLDAAAMMFLTVHDQVYTVDGIFFGLWLLPLGLLVLKSGFLPGILGALLIVSGVTDLADSVASLLGGALPPIAALPAAVGEFSIMLWLLIMGVKERPLETATT
jgi:hypothetical protein